MTAGTMTAPIAQPRDARRWRQPVQLGVVSGIVAVYLCLVGIVGTFHQQQLIAGVLTLGQAFLILTIVAGAYASSALAAGTKSAKVAAGTLTGLLVGAFLGLLVLVGATVNLRSIFLPASQQLYDILTLGLFSEMGAAAAWVPVAIGVSLGALAALVSVTPRVVRLSVLVAMAALLVLGVFAGILRTPMLAGPLSALGRTLFASQGLTIHGAIVTVSAALGITIGSAISERLGGSVRFGAVAGLVGGLLMSLAGGAVAQVPGAAVGGVIGIIAGGFAGGAVTRLVRTPTVARTVADLPPVAHQAGRGVFLFLVLVLIAAMPHMAGPFFASVVALVALYILMAFGLNITLGLAGLLDLGFVAFFAVGAYTMGLLTSLGPLGLANLPSFFLSVATMAALLAGLVAMFLASGALRGRPLGRWTRVAVVLAAGVVTAVLVQLLFSVVVPLGGGFLFSAFWMALPFAVFAAFLFGAFLGLPVLGIRGDYLAIATLGFGEIIALLARSNLMAPLLGGPQGLTLIPKPIIVPPTDPLAGPNQIYYIALLFALFIAFVASRLRDSRLGRAWIAIREDEDVAEALGINLVQTKLLAYALGAAFAGLGGALFASHIGAIFPSSINLFVSINVVAIIIIGGMGSTPGAVLGAIFLIGLPELLRDVGGTEYRFLFYGAALLLIMRLRPEGLWPSRVIQRELHVEGENIEAGDVPVGALVAEREAQEPAP